MKQTIIILLACLALTPAVRADVDVVLDEQGIATEGKVLGYKDRVVLLLLPATQRQLERPIGRVQKIALADHPEFTQAETLRSEKKYDQALAAYDKALRRARADWLKQLIQDRKYMTLQDSGQFDKALKRWLEMMDESDRSQAVQALEPKTLGPAGSKTNARAIDLLDRKVKSLSSNTTKNRDYIVQLLKMKMQIQRADENTKGLAETIEQIDRVTGKTPAGAAADGSASPVAPQPAAVSDQNTGLLLLESKFKLGKFAEVRKELDANFRSYRGSARPAALLLLARTQRELARTSGDQTLLVEAGLNFMTVFCEYSGSAQATEALYRAAEVNQALNNQAAARAALRELIDQYGSAKDPWVDKARTALEGQ